MAAAVEWYKHNGYVYVQKPMLPSMTTTNSTATKLDTSSNIPTSPQNNTTNPKGQPSAEQLEILYNKLGENVSFFYYNLNEYLCLCIYFI